MGAEPQLSERFAYDFDERCDGGRALLGGKGLGLAEMTQLGLPVPRGFTITTEACLRTMRDGHEPAGLAAEVDRPPRAARAAPRASASATADRPLLLSVRSGGPISMPGMMETILNLGLSRRARGRRRRGRTGNRRFAFDAYRRLIQMYGEVVAGIDADVFAVRARGAEGRARHRARLSAVGPRLRAARRQLRRALSR